MTDPPTDLYFRLCKDIVRQALDQPLTRGDGVLWMAFLHTHIINWQPGVIGAGPETMMPLTRRGAANVVAGQWGAEETVASAPDWPQDADKGGYLFWYYEYIHAGDWQKYSEIPPGNRQPVDIVARKFAAASRIASVDPEN